MKKFKSFIALALALVLTLSSTASAAYSAGQVTTTSARLNVRAAASTSAAILGQMHTGSYVTILGEKGDFYEILINSTGKTGFVSKAYTHVIGGLEAVVNTNSKNLLFRAEPNGSSAVVARAAKGTRLVVLDTTSQNGYWKVLLGNRVCYAYSEYLLINATNTSTIKVSSRQKAMADTALSMLGSTAYSGYCQRFIRISGEKVGLPSGSAGSALAACQMWRVSTGIDNIPIGAAVYLRSKNTASAGYKYGHVGVYVGNGQVVHAQDRVKQDSLTTLLKNYHYLGWGWQAGVDLR